MTPSDVDYQRAVDLLLAGELVAIPTETVYGLAADARNEAAVAKVFALKGRPSSNPLIVHLPDLAAAEAHAAEIGLTQTAFFTAAAALFKPKGSEIPPAASARDPIAVDFTRVRRLIPP